MALAQWWTCPKPQSSSPASTTGSTTIPTHPTIQEPRLVEKLKPIVGIPNLTLRAPPPAADRNYGFRPNITAWRFPEWFIVQETQVTGRASAAVASST